MASTERPVRKMARTIGRMNCFMVGKEMDEKNAERGRRSGTLVAQPMPSGVLGKVRENEIGAGAADPSERLHRAGFAEDAARHWLRD